MPAPLAAVLLSKVLLLKLAVLLPVTVRPPPWLLDALLPVKLDPCSHYASGKGQTISGKVCEQKQPKIAPPRSSVAVKGAVA